MKGPCILYKRMKRDFRKNNFLKMYEQIFEKLSFCLTTSVLLAVE